MKNLGGSCLENCINCKHSHVSQYTRGHGIEIKYMKDDK